MSNNQYTKCSFCVYYNVNGKQCLARPNSAYCAEAQREYNDWLRNKQGMPVAKQKSLRSWERGR